MSGALPKGWTQCHVGEVFAMFGGGTPNKGTPAFWGEGIPWLSSGDIKTSQIRSASESITDEGLKNSSSRLCRPGSVVVVVRSGILKHTLPIGVLETEAAINQDIKCFDSGSLELNAWLALALRASENEILGHNREGTTVQSVKSETLEKFVLPVPPIDEQRRIRFKLERVINKVSGCNARLVRIPVILKRFRQSVLAVACSGRLTVDWREQNEQPESGQEHLLRIKSDRLAAAQSKKEKEQIVEAFTEHGGSEEHGSEDTELPNSWAQCNVGMVGAVCNGSTPSRKLPAFWGGSIPWVSSGEVRNNVISQTHEGITEEGFESTSVRMLPKGTVLLAMIGEGKTRGQTAILKLPATINQNVAAVVLNNDHVSSEFLWHWFQFQYTSTREKGSGSGPQALNCQRVRELPFILPPVAEQKEIVRRVESLFTLADHLEARYKKGKAYVDKLTQSILAKAFRGELVPQDPNDEPADKLLERIRAGHASKGNARRLA